MYCMYLRKSRADAEAEARGEGETLVRHKKILLALAKKLSLNVTKIHRELVSGETIAARPVMQEVLSEVEQGAWKGVLVVEVERLARGDTMDQGLVAQTFKYSGTKIVTPMKTYNPNDEFDEEYFEFGLFMSRREYKTINRRLQRGRLQSVKEGKYVGNIPPYGYVRKKLQRDTGYTLEPCRDEAKVVTLIYEWYTGTERLGVSLIQNKLNRMKIPTRKGGDWTTSTVRNILSNPAYIGKIRWNARPQIKKMVDGAVVKERPRAKNVIVVKGLHESIIDEKIYNLAQKYLSENPSLPVPTKYITKNPLAGLIVCGMCGRKLNRRPYSNGYPDVLMCVGPTCPNISSHLYLVEKRLLQVLSDWMQKYRVEVKKQENQGTNLELELVKESLADVDKELGILKKQLNSLHDLLEQGVYSIDTFLERSQTINSKIDTAKISKKALENSLKTVTKKEGAQKAILPKMEKVVDLYWQLSTSKDKNLLLKEVLDRVVYTKTVNCRWHSSLDNFKLQVYPKLPK